MRAVSFRMIVGLFVIAIGIILILNNLYEGFYINIGQLFRTYWPVIPLVFGLNWLVLSFESTKSTEGKRVFFSWGQFVTALVAIGIGIVFLGNNLGWFNIETRLFWSLFWPIILILIGVNLLRGRSSTGGKGGRFVFMGGANIGGAQPWKLDSGSYFAFMGSIEIDLTAAEIAEGETVLDLTAIMGGIDVKIPQDLSVIYDGSAVLGGVTFRDQEDGGIIAGRKVEHNIDESSKSIVRIQARAIMGGIEIK